MKNGIINVLVVVDMQNDFVYERGSLYVHKDDVNETKDVVGEVCKLISNGPWDVVICTRDTHYGNYSDTLEGKKLPVEHCIVGTWGHEIHDDVKEALDANYQKFDKTTFGHLGFANNDIPYALDMQNDIVVPVLAGEIASLEHVEIVLDVVAQGVEAGLVQEQHLAGFLPVGADGQGQVQAVPLAGAEQQCQQGQKDEPDFRHKNGLIGQS